VLNSKAAGVPGVTVIWGIVVVTVTPPMVAVTVVALPTFTPVNIAVYVPLELSVVLATVPVLVPPLNPKTTVAPPEDKILPLMSLPWRVKVTFAADTTVVADAVTVDVAAEMAPGFT